jgi:CheY-like chemotaxis protein
MTLLVADNDVVVAADIEAEATKLGMSVAIAPDPQIAIQLATTIRFKAAFVDVNLRQPVDGLDLARTLATETRTRVVIMSGYAPPELAGRMGGIENLPILAKPFDHEAITFCFDRSLRTPCRSRVELPKDSHGRRQCSRGQRSDSSGRVCASGH